MWSTTRLFLVFLSVSGISSVPVSVPIERTFNYDAQNQVFNDGAPDHVARWDLHAKLTYQTFPKHSIIKLDRVVVSTFNGKLEDHGKVKTTELPPEAKVLTEPFVFHRNNTISVRADEPNWSLNMKRSIASILYIDTESIEQADLVGTSFAPEDNMYGNCNVTYKMKKDDGRMVLDKTIDIDECGGEIQSYWSANKIVDCSGLQHDQFTREATRRYTFSGDKLSHVQNKQIDSIRTDSTITFHVSPNDKHKIRYKQSQYFAKLDYGEAKQQLDASEATSNVNLKFEHGDRPMDGRSAVGQTSGELSKTFYDSLSELKSEITKATSTNSWEIEKAIFEVWENMDKQTFSSYGQIMENIEDDQVMKDIVLYVLPYVGNDNALKYMQKLITSNRIDAYQMFRMISLFPNYVNSYDETMLESMKVLLNLPTENKLVRNSGILGYSRIVHKAYKKHAISKDAIDRVVGTYLDSFQTSKDYERRMVHLLGLHNMDVGLDVLLPVVRDPNESHHLRLIAINSAADKLKTEPDQVRDIFMPMLKNDSSAFELRVAALNVLLGAGMSAEDYDAIYEYLKDESGDLAHQHLYNYFYSTLSSYAADTECETIMSTVSENYLAKLKPPRSTDAFLTGNYRLAFSNRGPDYGSTTAVETIGDPVTKSLDLVQITFDSFRLGLQTKQTYYLKIHGIADRIVGEIVRSRSVNKKTVKELIDIVKKHGLTSPNQNDPHVEFIVLENDKAVFAAHFDLEYVKTHNVKKMASQLIDTIFGDHTYVTFPVMDYLHLPSDAGTDLTLDIVEELVGYDDSENIEGLLALARSEYRLRHRSLKSITKSMDVYNPISYVKLGAMASVIDNTYGEAKFRLDVDDDHLFYVEFDNNDFVYDSQFEIVKATYVDDKRVLHAHCNDCKASLALEDDGEDVEKYEKYFNTTILGFDLTNTINGTEPDDDEKFLKALEKCFGSTIGNFEVVPMSYFWYVYQNYDYHQHYTPNWNTLTERTQIAPNEENPLKTRVKFYVDYGDETSDREIVPGSYGTLSFASYIRTIKDDKLVEHANVSFGFRESPGLYNQSYHMSVDYNEADEYSKICFDLDTKYPKLSPDYYSIEPAEPTKSKFTIMYDSDSKPITACDDNSLLTLEINGLFSVTKEQQELFGNETNSPLKRCIDDSKGLRYTAPTEACQKASEEMSTYRRYDLQGIVSINNKIRNMLKDNEINEVEPMFDLFETDNEKFSGDMNFTIELLDSKFKGYYTDGDGSTEEIDDSFIRIFSPTHRQTYLEDEMLVTSKDFLDDMEEFEYGLTSACHVTSSFVHTFAEETVANYTYGKGDEIVGMIDCDSGTNGFTFAVLENKLLKTVVWTEGYKISIEPQGNALRVTVDGVVVDNKTLFDENGLQVYFVADDALFIKSVVMHLYYNTEFIRAEIYSSYINKLCGLCSKQKNFITV